MAASYTHKELSEVTDMAPDFGLGDLQAVRFANSDLETETTGLAHELVKPGKRPPFASPRERGAGFGPRHAGDGEILTGDRALAWWGD